MKISIRNFRGCSEADIDASGLTLIAGKNHSGKTSIIQATAAALTGNAIPIPGLAKTNAGLLVRSGSGGGQVSVDSGIGVSTVSYPAAKRESTGEPATISDDAAGLHSFLDDTAAQRSQTVSELLHALPTREQLAAELAKIGASEAGVERVWELIQKAGWDNAHHVAKETGVRLKGQWDNESGQRYGAKKAESWTPADWTEDMRDATEESLTAAVKQETEWLEAAISHRAVDDAELARRKDLVDSIPVLQAQHKTETESVAALEKCIRDMTDRLIAMPSAIAPVSMPCPHCGKPVQVYGVKLIAPEEIPKSELSKRAAAVADCKKSIEETREELKRVSAALAVTAKSIAVAQAAVTAPAASASTEPTAGVDEVRGRLDFARKRLDSWRKRARAESIHNQIMRNQEIIDMLAPDGLRLTTLKAALGSLNNRLRDLAAMAGWRAPELKQDMSVTYGGSLYLTLSESEQYRVRILYQIAFAELQDSQTVLIDRADILDSTGRNGLIKLIRDSKIGAIIAMTVNSKDKCPVMKAVGGVSYWVEGGVAVAI